MKTTYSVTLNPAWISNYIHYTVWDEITYPILNFNGATVDVKEWISNFIPHFIAYGITLTWFKLYYGNT